jgi:Ca-activated chloride channel family protein
VGALVCALPAAAQTLSVNVNLINLFVVVKDSSGAAVRGLARGDFRIYDDDVPQKVEIFESEGDIRSTLGVFIDSSGSMVDILPISTRSTREFVRNLPAEDDFFVVSFGTTLRLLRDFRGSLRRFDERLDGLKPWGTSILYDGLIYGLDKTRESQNERKALVVLTDGHDNGSENELRDVRDEVRRSPAMLYFVAVGSQKLIDRHTLEDLASMSGGQALYVGKNENIPAMLESIRTDLASQYYLGYYVAHRPGFHRIRVEIPGRNVTVRARIGYLM